MRSCNGTRWHWHLRDEVTGHWRKLHNEELHGLYSSPIIPMVMKSRRERRQAMKYVCRSEKHTKFYSDSLKKEDHLEDPNIDMRIILKLTLQKWDGRVQMQFI
jgi:hypothetical protein